MTKIIKYLLCLSLVLPVGAGAQMRSLKVDTRAEVKTEVKADVEARKATSTERKMERQTEKVERKDEKMKMRVELVARNFRNAIERLENILGRLESRIEKMRSNGADVTESAKFAAEARTYIGAAKVSLNAFLSASSTSTTTAKQLHAEVKKHLTAVREALVKSLRALKASVRIDAGATTTVQESLKSWIKH